jgi:hypothetical protein
MQAAHRITESRDDRLVAFGNLEVHAVSDNQTDNAGGE